MTTLAKVKIWKNVAGIAGRSNDIIYKSPTFPPSQDILVYFGGDVQDIEENMQKHTDSKKYVQWSLENTAHVLSTNFPKKHIFIVCASRMHITSYAVFTCFDNFVPGNEYGIPTFKPTYNALKHLKALMVSFLNQLKTYGANEGITSTNIEDIKLTLMGFSKGCVVLNQMLHEFHYYQENSASDVEINNFIRLIQSMWWLDGGHGGSKDTWITDKSILKSFAKLRIPVQVHVTPYQVKDSRRPWICSEENIFSSVLKDMGVLIQRTIHFADKPPSLNSHFNVLKAAGDCTK